MAVKEKPQPSSGEAAEIPCDCEDSLFRSSDDVRTGYVRGIENFDVKPVTYNVIDGLAVFEGDIVLGTPEEVAGVSDEIQADHDPSEVTFGVGITGQRFRWPGGRVPWTSTAPLRPLVLQAIAHWEANTNIRFIERTAANAASHDNFISFEAQDGCFSRVGMQGGMQVISLGTGCGFGAAVHEIGHAIGLWHEQSREDRNANVNIVWANIIPNREHNFNQHITDGDDIGGYDFGSIMHYGRTAFTRNGLDTIVPVGGQAIGQRAGLSAGDIAAVRALYPQLEPSRSWRGTQFSATLGPNATQTWFTHSWPFHWFVVWLAVPTAPPVDGPAQLEMKLRVRRQSDTLVKYFFTVTNLTAANLTFETRYEVLGWSRDFR